MSGYSESALQRKLAEVKISAPSIQGVALWIMHHKKHYRATVRTWYRQLVAAQSGHKLTLLYLANDVVQNCRKKQPEIEAEFGLVMKKVFTHLADEALDEKIVTRMTRLVNVWKERAIFDRKVQDEVAKVWTNKAKGSGPPAKKARMEKVEKEEAEEEEEDVVSGLALVRRMADQRKRRAEDEGSLGRLEEEVRERRRLGEALADLVRRQQEELLQAEEQLVRMKARQCGYHQPKPHEMRYVRGFEQPIDYEPVEETDQPFDRYPPALPTRPHGARADGWGLMVEDDDSVGCNDTSNTAEDLKEDQLHEKDVESNDLGDKYSADNNIQGTVQSSDTIDDAEQAVEIANHEDSNSETNIVELDDDETAEVGENVNVGPEETNNTGEDRHSECDKITCSAAGGIAEQSEGAPVLESLDTQASEEMMTKHNIARRETQDSIDVQNVSEGFEPAEVRADVRNQERIESNGQDQLDSGPESDSDPNTLTEESEGVAAGTGESNSMPILT